MATATAAAAESPRPPEVGDEAHSGGEEERPRDDDDDRPRDDRHLDDVRSDRSVDSEYTYETVEDSDDEEDGGRGKGSKAAGGGGTGGGGWFGFLRRGRRRGGGKGEEDDEEERSEGEEEEISEEESEVEEGEGAGATEAEATGRDDEGGDDEGEGGDASSSSDDGRHDHPLLAPSPVPSSKASLAVPTEHSAEEAALMAEAIRRVQDRIASNGGNLYGALDPADKKLVDDLRGVDDPKTIEEAAARSAEGGAGEKEAAREEPAQSRGESLPTGEEGASASRTEEEGEESEGGEEAEAEYSEDEEEDDDERPTLEERRSLLSLAAEHDRVDVLQELLGAKGGGGGGPGGGGADEDDVDARGGLRATLLAGVSYDESAPADEPFVPPPLHVAVAHGSVGAASCLLRIGADPSLRPIAPPAYLGKSASGRGGGGSPFQRTGSARSAGTEGDRNYRKYHDATAWELAFGSAVAVEDEGDGGDRDADDGDPGETEAEGGRRGWFGFGKAKQRANEPDRAEAPAEPLPGAVDGKRRRIKKRSPLNLPPSKVEGIRHAFLSEALRAIGSDEADRLTQLLDAGVEVDAEVGGKCLGEWARDMDAEGCRGALEERGAAVDGTVVGAAAEKKENLDESKADESAEADGEEGEGAVPDARSVDDSSPADPQLAPEVVDERLAGLSAADVKSLALEARHLLPQLTACRDDLAAEVRICRSLLDDADASSAGGGRGLNSASLLDLVRSLKAQRAAAEEASREWRKAWEEREDELDFFWEEVLDDRTRAELGPILARTDNEDVVATESHLVHVDSGATGGWGKLFAEADDEVRGLRTEISALAEESARLTREVGDRGMGGALGLTRSLREEVRGAEEALRAAREGEARCRRKIEIIQKRLGYLPGYDDDPERGEGYDRGQDRREDRPERRAEPRPVPGHPVSHPADRPGQSHEDTEPTSHAGGVDKEAKTGTEGPRLQEVVRLEGARERRPGPEAGRGGPSPPRAEPVSADIDREGRATPKTNGEGRPTIAVERDEVDDYGSCEIPSSNSLLDEEVSEGVKVQKSDAEEPHGSGLDVSEDDTGNVATEEAIDNSRDMVDKAESEAREAVIEERGGSPVGELRHAKPPAESSCDPSKPTLNGTDSHASARSAKPSAAIAEGASTAIVIHDPDYARAGSLSSQIWDILRMIVGLGRVVPPSRSGSYHDVSPEDNPHIMIV